MDLFADNDELFAKLKAGNPGYDVIVPTNDNLERMIKADMVIPLDHSKIPNIANIDKPLQGRRPSIRAASTRIPYMWGTLGIGYRKSKVEGGVVDSWKVLLDSDEMAGRISLLGDAQNVIGAALKYLGYSFNSTNPDELKKVEELLIARRRTSRSLPTTTARICSPRARSMLAMEWNGDILQVMAEDDGHHLCRADRGLAPVAGHDGHPQRRAAS